MSFQDTPNNNYCMNDLGAESTTRAFEFSSQDDAFHSSKIKHKKISAFESIAKDSFFDQLEVIDQDVIKKGKDLVRKYGKD